MLLQKGIACHCQLHCPSVHWQAGPAGPMAQDVMDLATLHDEASVLFIGACVRRRDESHFSRGPFASLGRARAGHCIDLSAGSAAHADMCSFTTLSQQIHPSQVMVSVRPDFDLLDLRVLP